jgi:16S rRNA processing protein RimM
MGRVAAPYAVRGWLKIQPFSEYVDTLLDHEVWRLGRGDAWRSYRLLEGKVHGRTLLVSLEGVEDREAAESMRGMEIAIERDALPEPEEGEYYWGQLIGLDVVNLAGENLGKVTGILETGAHDVLEVQGDRSRLIPFVGAYVSTVDLDAGRIVADWSLDY